ncbi:MAG: 30S ribosomal protein S2 [Planctomycetota bacterium]|nr:30S ribosomal protein S2 [Planctomycetota bacterium]
MGNLTVKELIESGVHFGCRAARWNPQMAPFIHGRRNQLHVINLKETMRGILRAQNLLQQLAASGSSVLWVGTKRQVKGVIQDAGQGTGMPIVTERWIGGTLTNFSVIRSRLRRLEELEKMEEDGSIEAFSKKMISKLRRERRKITRNLGGIREMSNIPGAMIVVDPGREYNAVREARKMGVIVIGLLDTDCDPASVDIVIPGNDDSLKSVRLVISQLVEAVEEGCASQREQLAAVDSAEKHADQYAGDEPRPTRTVRDLPGSMESRQEAAAAEASETTATATADAPAPEAAPAATATETAAESQQEAPSDAPAETPVEVAADTAAEPADQ